MSGFLSQMDLGKYGAISDPGALGREREFEDLDRSQYGVKPLLSGMIITARLVKNNTGGVLPPGTLVVWDNETNFHAGRAIGGTAGATDAPAGVVDPWISQSVPDGKFFWMITRGPCKFLFTTGTTLDEGDQLASAASGRAQKFVIGTTNESYKIGRSLEAVDTAIASGTLFRGFFGRDF